jgi:hypothetical protein
VRDRDDLQVQEGSEKARGEGTPGSGGALPAAHVRHAGHRGGGASARRAGGGGAFVGGDDGADFYRVFTPIYKNHIKENGFIAYEIGFDQAKTIKDIAEHCDMSCEIINDLSGNPRVAVLRLT